MHDIGILASYDPVALDQACVDLVYSAEDGASLVQRIESRNGLQNRRGRHEYTAAGIDLYLVLFQRSAGADFRLLGAGHGAGFRHFRIWEKEDSCGIFPAGREKAGRPEDRFGSLAV